MQKTATQKYRRLDRSFLWHPYSRHSDIRGRPFPVIVRGKGVYLYDNDGRRYFDAISSWWACNLGHGHPHIVAAIRRQSRLLQHSILGNLAHPGAIELAARIAGLFPDRRRVFFAGDGASAVEAALKIAVQYWHNLRQPRRMRFVSFENSYHGDTLGAVAVGFSPAFHAPFRNLRFPVHRVPAPDCAACRLGLRPEACHGACFADMSAMLERHAASLAAVIVEPLCRGAAGMRMYAPVYLQRLADACRRFNVLLIVDEIAMGFGRTGRMFAFEHAGIAPDIVCIGKGLTGGYLPMSATVVRAEIYDAFGDHPRDGTFYHGHTFAGNPIAAAAALAALQVYHAANISEQARVLGALLHEGMLDLCDISGVCRARTLGLIGAIDLCGNQKGVGAARARMISARLRMKGILLRPLGEVLYLMPPLITPKSVLTEALRCLRTELIASVK